MKSRVVYLVDETLGHPVLQSQSLLVIARLIEAGVTVDLLVANGVNAAHEEEIARRFLGPSTRVVFLSKGHRGSSALSRAQRAMGRALAQRRAASFIDAAGPVSEPIILHARGSAMYLGAHLRLQFVRTRLVADVRGDGAAEARFGIGGLEGERRAAAIDRMDARVFSRTDHLLCVSQTLLAELQRRFVVPCPASVIPCVADERRFFPDAAGRLLGRASLGLSSEPLLVYAGSIGQWHQFEATLETFTLVGQKHQHAKFLIATKDADTAMVIVSSRAELRNRTMVRSWDATDVAQWLKAADVGLLLRAPDPLNHVACPTKFAEYVLSGLGVVVSEEIGDLAGWVRGLELGVCVSGVDVANAASACTALMEKPAANDDRAARVQRATSVLSIGARVHDWLEVYKAALQRTPA